MYELLDINPKLKTDFFHIIEQTIPKKNWNSLLLIALKKSIHKLFPEMPFYLLQNYMQKSFQIIHQRLNHNIHTRAFINDKEAIEVWHNTYDEMIEKLSKSNKLEDKLNLDLIDYIYDLLEYDQVTLIDGQKYLSSYINLSYLGEQHYEAFEKLEAIEKAKSADKNIDTATNRGKTVRDRVKFLNPKFELDIMHPEIDSKEAELQSAVVSIYCKETRMMARCIHLCAELSKNKEKNFEVNAIGKLRPYINSDDYIPKIKIYKSWYAYVINIYNRSSNNRIPVEKALNMARLSSYFLFHELRNKQKPLISVDTAKKPIRERSFYDGLRIHEFTDNRLKIKRSKEELAFTEEYMREFIINLQTLSKS